MAVSLDAYLVDIPNTKTIAGAEGLVVYGDIALQNKSIQTVSRGLHAIVSTEAAIKFPEMKPGLLMYPYSCIIRIGRKYHELFPEEVYDTLKHEILHFIYPTHGAAFKKEAARIGASVRAKPHPSLCKPPKYLYVCPGCGKEYPRQRRLRMASCGACSKSGFDSRYKLVLVRLRDAKNANRPA